MKKFATVLLLAFFMFVNTQAGNLVIQNDSAIITYSNIYNEAMSNADSVVGDFIQGSSRDDTTHFVMTQVSTGYYFHVEKIDSSGLILIEITAWNWNGSDNIGPLAIGYYSNAIGNFKGAATADSGANLVTFVFLDTVNNEQVGSLKHGVQNAAQTIDYDTKFSEADGTKNWSLSSGSFIVQITSSLYTANSVPDTVVITTNQTDTIKVYPSATNWPHKSRVYSTIYEKDATGREGVRVVVTTPNSIRYNDYPIYQFPETAWTNSDGYFFFDLIRSDSARPANKAIYSFTATDTAGGDIIFENIALRIPDSSTYQLRWWRN